MRMVIEKCRNLARFAQVQYCCWLTLWGYEQDRKSKSHQTKPCEEEFRRAMTEQGYSLSSSCCQSTESLSENIGALVNIAESEHLVFPFLLIRLRYRESYGREKCMMSGLELKEFADRTVRFGIPHQGRSLTKGANEVICLHRLSLGERRSGRSGRLEADLLSLCDAWSKPHM